MPRPRPTAVSWQILGSHAYVLQLLHLRRPLNKLLLAEGVYKPGFYADRSVRATVNSESPLSPLRKSLLMFGYTLFGTKIPSADPPRYGMPRGAPFQILCKMLRLRTDVLANTVLLSLSGKVVNFRYNFHSRRTIMMKRTSLILIAVFAMVMLPAAFAQGTPSQSQDPSTQTPSPQQPSQSPNTDDPSSNASSPDNGMHSFVGSIVKNGDKYMLRTGDTDYQLDDQAQASKFAGKDVKVTGQVDRESDTIRVQSIEPASSM